MWGWWLGRDDLAQAGLESEVMKKIKALLEMPEQPKDFWLRVEAKINSELNQMTVPKENLNA